jgi:hypothetical protein
MSREGLVVAQMVLVLAVMVVLGEGSQGVDMHKDRARDEKDCKVEEDTPANKDVGNAVQRTYSAGGKDKEHVDTLSAIEHELVEVADKHEEVNVHKHESVMIHEQRSLVVNEHESVVVVHALVWWVPVWFCVILVLRQPPCFPAEQQNEKLVPWGQEL